MAKMAKDGCAFYSVITPSVAREYELPMWGELSEDELVCLDELDELAEEYGTSVRMSRYELL
jgi:hypothetical protein